MICKLITLNKKKLLKSGACRCHICGQLGHPAEAGLCPYIPCSFCKQFGHWNHSCPNIEKVSKTLCEKCTRFGHASEVKLQILQKYYLKKLELEFF